MLKALLQTVKILCLLAVNVFTTAHQILADLQYGLKFLFKILFT